MEEREIEDQSCLECPLSSIAFDGGEGRGEEARQERRSSYLLSLKKWK
jgi:hypothetical protein